MAVEIDGIAFNMANTFAPVSLQVGMIPNLVYAVSIVSFFDKIEFHSKIVNKISKATMMVYLIHQMPYIIPHIWDDVFRVNIFSQYPFMLYSLYLLFVIGVLYVIALILDYFVNHVVNHLVKCIVALK